MNRLSYELFFDLESFEHRSLFKEGVPVWNALKHLKAYLESLSLGKIECDIPSSTILDHPELISIGKGTVVEPGAYIQGPCVIGKNCQVRHGSYIRPYLLTGDDCVIGHATETKHAIFLNGAKAPHFNYVGDSILGRDVNIGAGVICANFRLDKKLVPVRVWGEQFSSELKKFGAIVGDSSQIGCNTVLNPGLLLRKLSLIRSCESVSESNLRKDVSHV
ncbi:MAG: UDP-N-acetylglucosamine diphosphorylase [Simkania sp.]|nr:UDP-N-acetylglucosamine diphosphorylase [Simkania sp.]MCP5490995.1 UDP-N-acetylglucosamine diphosphorylase [Chlamydiales bacterium]